MSTKIYNGYFLPLMTLVELQTFMQIVKGEMMPISHRGIAQFLANFSTRIIDLNSLERKGPLSEMSRRQLEKSGKVKLSPISEAYIVLAERYQNVVLRMQRDPDVDWTCNWTFIPHRGKLLALLYTEQPELIKAWERHPIVKDYHYQNSTDKPADITEEEWDDRAKDWHDAVGRAVPAEVGFSTQLFGHYTIPQPEPKEVLQLIPDYALRLSNVATDIVSADHLKSMGDISPERYGPALSQLFEWIDSDEGRGEVQKTKDAISDKLKKKITLSDLSTDIEVQAVDKES